MAGVHYRTVRHDFMRRIRKLKKIWTIIEETLEKTKQLHNPQNKLTQN